MAQRAFTLEDQLAFAELSGDFNPVHTEPVIARRLIFGRQVVHGMHALLWGLDDCFRSRNRTLEIQRISAGFNSGIGLGENVRSICSGAGDDRVEIKLTTGAALAAWVDIEWRHADGAQPFGIGAARPLECRDRTIDEIASARGSIPLYLDARAAGRLFPGLAATLPPLQLAELLAATRLVGMECPGRHSVFSGLDLTFSREAGGAPQLDYRVASVNKPLSRVLLAVTAPGMRGQIHAFFRPGPQHQAPHAALRRRVSPEEFSGQRALIIGGSRGLGEVAAKLLCAGGARVSITYHQGRADAERVVGEIKSHGAEADCFGFDVMEPRRDLPAGLADHSGPLHVYYFATCHIFGSGKGIFSPERFSAFCDFYVTGFLRTIEAVAEAVGGPQSIFYPSSTAIESLPLDMGAYAAAKAAGEVACDYLQKSRPGVVIYKARLPRLATDQTVSLLPAGNQDPVPVLLEHLRSMRNARRVEQIDPRDPH